MKWENRVFLAGIAEGAFTAFMLTTALLALVLVGALNAEAILSFVGLGR